MTGPAAWHAPAEPAGMESRVVAAGALRYGDICTCHPAPAVCAAIGSPCSQALHELQRRHRQVRRAVVPRRLQLQQEGYMPNSEIRMTSRPSMDAIPTSLVMKNWQPTLMAVATCPVRTLPRQGAAVLALRPRPAILQPSVLQRESPRATARGRRALPEQSPRPTQACRSHSVLAPTATFAAPARRAVQHR